MSDLKQTLLVGAVAVLTLAATPLAAQEQDQPNILVIWGDDIGWYNISAYNLGVMGYRTPNIDRIAREGALFTDWYGQQSCTAGRAAFVTGQSPVRTGLTKVGLPGADLGLKEEDPTIAGLLKSHGYMTGQYGKNHLGDLDEHMPTHHGFDEFFGNLYHLNAEEEPENPDYPQDPTFKEQVRPARRDQVDRQSGRHADDRGHRPADQGADGDGRRGGDRRRARLHRAGACRGQAVLPVVELHPHAHLDPPQARVPGRHRHRHLSRWHGRARRHGRAAARQARRARHRRQHHRDVLDRQRRRGDELAGRRHDAVPRREEHPAGKAATGCRP